MSIRTMRLRDARRRGRLYAEVELPRDIYALTGNDPEYVADLLADGRMELTHIEQDADAAEQDPVPAAALHHGLLVLAALRLKVPRAQRLAHRRARARVSRHLARAGIHEPILTSWLHQGFTLTRLGRALERGFVAYAWGALLTFAGGLFLSHIAGALTFLLGLLICVLAAAELITVQVIGTVTGRSTGAVVHYPDGSSTEMSYRQREAYLDARAR